MKKKMLYLSLLLNLLLLAGFTFFIYKIGGWNHLIYKIKNRGLAGTYQHRVEHLDKLPNLNSTDIVFLGNSITQHCEWAELFKNSNIKNRGIAGDGVEGVLERLPKILDAKPKAIFLMIGVNDLFFHEVGYVIEQYENILETCYSKSPNTQMVLQSVLPINDAIKYIPISNESIRKLNKEIEKTSRKYNYTFVDLYSKFENDSGKLNAVFSVDGIHLNGKGYLVWKDVLLDKFPFLSSSKASSVEIEFSSQK